MSKGFLVLAQNNSTTDYNLNAHDMAAFASQGYPWTNVKTNTLYNNGIWRICLQQPVLSDLLKRKEKIHHIFETSHTDVLSKLQQYFKES